jgi:protein phosphatase
MTDTAAVQSEPGGSRTFRVLVAQKSDVGLVRSENQDFAILSTPSEDSAGKGRLMIVADGMGGHRGGATASRLAATTIKDTYLQSPVTDPVAALRDALTEANRKIFSEAQSNPDVRGMGTTTSALVIRDGLAYIAHVGDSRIYLIRNGEIRQLTDDHSLVASMVREGLLTSKEAESHPRRNVLQRSMGVSEQVEIDVLKPLDLQPGDTFVLCSDGLHGLVREPEMLEVGQLPIQAAVDEFVKRALDRGAPDNVTVVVARVEGDHHAAAPTVDLPRPTDESEVDTAKMAAIAEPALATPPRSGAGKLLGIVAVLAIVAGGVAYLLGYRLDVEAIRGLFSR